MKIIALITIAIMILPSALAETSLAGNHSVLVGTPGINKFLINWTDSRNYTEIEKSIDDWPSSDSGAETIFNLYASENVTDGDYSLWYQIFWHPEKMRPSSVKPDKYPFEITPEEIDLRSNVSIQGIKGVCVRIKEKKTYNGSNKPPTIEDPLFYASYFPDEYTEVIIHAPPAKWNESEFKSLLRSLEITPPEGYY